MKKVIKSQLEYVKGELKTAAAEGAKDLTKPKNPKKSDDANQTNH